MSPIIQPELADVKDLLRRAKQAKKRRAFLMRTEQYAILRAEHDGMMSAMKTPGTIDTQVIYKLLSDADRRLRKLDAEMKKVLEESKP